MGLSNKELKALITIAGKLDPSLQKAFVKANTQTKNLKKETGLFGLIGEKTYKLLGKHIETFINKNKLAKASFTTFSKGATMSSKIAGKALKGLGVGVAGVVTASITAFGLMAKKGISSAQDLTEVQNVVDKTFGKANVAKIDVWSKSLLKSHGMAELAAKRYSSTLGAMMKSSGIANDDMMIMSQNLTMLVGDMGSFYNIGADEMFEKIKSGISGESEPLKAIGINMSAANLEAYALSQGIKTAYSEMSEASKIQLRYNYIMSATKDAQNDFSQTSDSLANQQKLLKENFTSMVAGIMQNALPALSQGAQMLNNYMANMDTKPMGEFVGSLSKVAVELLPHIMKFLPVLQNALNTIMPPLMRIINVVVPPIIKVLDFLIKIIGAGLDGIAKVVEKIAGWFGGKKSKSSMETFANGGFSAKPAIFGEAGLEVAIPIKRGNPRSLALLERTAHLLGVDELYAKFGNNYNSSSENVQLIYSPNITTNSNENFESILRGHTAEIQKMLEKRKRRKRRMSFGVS